MPQRVASVCSQVPRSFGAVIGSTVGGHPSQATLGGGRVHGAMTVSSTIGSEEDGHTQRRSAWHVSPFDGESYECGPACAGRAPKAEPGAGAGPAAPQAPP